MTIGEVLAHGAVLPALLMLLALAPAALADTPTPAPQRLWPGAAPGSRGDQEADTPEITVYLPPAEKATGTAVIVCPGGGYTVLMMTYEGHDIAHWLNAHGVAAIVLKYRLKPYAHPIPVEDGKRAVRTVRANAHKWGIAPDRIGMMGFSAGGHLASYVGTQFDAGDPSAADPIERASSRPDFLVLIYPAIDYHGAEPSDHLVTARTPPTFLAHAKTDEIVPVEQSARFYAALKAHHVPAEFLELPTGAHGLGCGKGEQWEAWQARCLAWMRGHGLLVSRTGKR